MCIYAIAELELMRRIWSDTRHDTIALALYYTLLQLAILQGSSQDFLSGFVRYRSLGVSQHLANFSDV